MAKIEEKVEELVKEKIENIGYSLYDVEYAKEGPNYYLRIYIDKPDGIDLNDCEKVNDEINDLLDQADYIKDQYFLEVSSPGIERILKKDSHLEQNIGNQVEAKLYKKDENGRKNSGRCGVKKEISSILSRCLWKGAELFLMGIRIIRSS